MFCIPKKNHTTSIRGKACFLSLSPPPPVINQRDYLRRPSRDTELSASSARRSASAALCETHEASTGCVSVVAVAASSPPMITEPLSLVLGTRYPMTLERACIAQTRDNARWCWLRWSAPPPPPDNPTCSPRARARLVSSRNFPRRTSRYRVAAGRGKLLQFAESLFFSPG